MRILTNMHTNTHTHYIPTHTNKTATRKQERKGVQGVRGLQRGSKSPPTRRARTKNKKKPIDHSRSSVKTRAKPQKGWYRSTGYGCRMGVTDTVGPAFTGGFDRAAKVERQRPLHRQEEVVPATTAVLRLRQGSWGGTVCVARCVCEYSGENNSRVYARQETSY